MYIAGMNANDMQRLYTGVLENNKELKIANNFITILQEELSTSNELNHAYEQINRCMDAADHKNKILLQKTFDSFDLDKNKMDYTTLTHASKERRENLQQKIKELQQKIKELQE